MKIEEVQVSCATRLMVRRGSTLIGYILILPWIHPMYDLGYALLGLHHISSQRKAYSCWPVIVTPYNLPPDMCMTKPYMFLSCVIPGPDSPTAGIDIYLQPLIDDLKRLWDGVLTYDISRKQNFTMRAALMWTINDFPAYGMLSG